MVPVIEPEIIARRAVRDLEQLEQAALRPVRRANTMMRDAAMKALASGSMKLDIVELAKNKLLPALAHAMALAHILGQKRSVLAASSIAFSNDAWTDVKHVLRKATNLRVKDLQERYGMSAAKTLREAVEKIDAKIKGSLLEISLHPESRAKAMKLLSSTLDAAGVGDKSASQLETIFRTAMYQAAAAGRYEADKQFGDEIWGYMYITMGDDRVRDEHVPLHGVTLPKEDPFWQSYWPPNGWNCRCQVIPLFTERRVKKPKSLPELDEEFDVPPGTITFSWDEDAHPREPAGSDKGGEFASKKGKVIIHPASYTKQFTQEEIDATLKDFPEVTEDNVHDLLGAPDDANIEVNVYKNSIRITATGDREDAGFYRMQRTLGRDTSGAKICYNSFFICQKTSSGFGTKVFAKQVNELSALGYKEIRTTADRDENMNGYYTWPRLGYDANIVDQFGFSGDIPSYAKKHGLKRVSDFMRKEEHRWWWQENGESVGDAKFSLKEGSLSRQVLDAYLSEKGIALAWNEEDHPREPAGSGKGGEFRDKLDAVLDSVKHWTHYSEQQLREGLATDMVMRARVAGSILQSGLAVKDAGSQVALGDEEHVKKITIGNQKKPLEEFAEIPAYDLAVLTKIIQQDKPLSGEARCFMATRVVECGSTTRPGSYRHELGHAVRAALGGEKHTGRTTMTKAVSSEFDKVLARVKAQPEGMKLKKPHEWYETEYGVAGRRSLDNWEENFAEHYRLYHREIYRDRHEGKGHVAAYRERHPGWAKIWDAHYTAALLVEKLKEESLAWDESEHPREAAGSDKGGEFTSKGTAVRGRYYHGRSGDANFGGERSGPVFLTKQKAVASWYAIDREGGPDPTVAYVDVSLDNVASLKELDSLAKELKVTEQDIFDAGGDPQFPFDAVYVQRVTGALRDRGYDGVMGSDIFLSGETDIVVALNPKGLSVKKQQKIKDYLTDESLAWDESEHPREPAGSDSGGEFTNKRITIPSYENMDDVKALAKKLGFETLSELVAATGSDDDYKRAQITIDSAYNRINVNITHDLYEMQREFHLTTSGVKHAYNAGFDVAEGLRGQGIGVDVFTRQVKNLAKHGYSYIATSAARSSEQNGFYTWARFGYDAELRLDKDSKSYGRRRMSIYALQKGFTKVSDFMKKPDDREWWRDNGVSFEGEFDLKEGSQSRRVLDAYNAAKREPVAAAWDEDEHPREPSGSDKGGEFTEKEAAQSKAENYAASHGYRVTRRDASGVVQMESQDSLHKLTIWPHNWDYYGPNGHSDSKSIEKLRKHLETLHGKATYAEVDAPDLPVAAFKEEKTSTTRGHKLVGKAPASTAKFELDVIPSKVETGTKLTSRWVKKLTSDEKQAVLWWQEATKQANQIKDREQGSQVATDVESIATAFKSALDKAPKYEGNVWRAMKGVTPDTAAYTDFTTVGNVVELTSTTSTSRAPSRMGDFLIDDARARGNIVFRIKSKSGVDISPVIRSQDDEIPDEKEILLRPSTKLKVNAVVHGVPISKKSKATATVVDMEEL